MNPESTFEQDLESESEARSLDDVLRLTKAELATLSLPELEALEADIQREFLASGYAAKPFSEFASALRPAQQRELAKPDRRQQLLADYLGSQVALARQKKKGSEAVAATEQAESQRREAGTVKTFFEQLNQVDPLDGLDQATGTFKTLKSSARQAEKDFQAWSQDRRPVNPAGRPVDYSAGDQRLIDKIDEQRDRQIQSGQEYHELTDRLEVTFARGLKEFKVFGEDLEEIGPSSRYDDVANHIDLVAKLQPTTTAQSAPPVYFGIDFTMTRQEDIQAKKVLDNLDRPLRQLKYGTQSFSAGTEYIPVVLTVDRARVNRLRYMYGFQDARRPVDHPDLGAAFETETEAHRDAEVFQYELLREVHAQLAGQQAELVKRDAPAANREYYQRAIDVIMNLLEQRKNLTSIASEVERPEIREVYRLSDPDFIRRVPQIMRASVENQPRAF